MKRVVFLFVFMPAVLNAQFNRSATELARENVHDYITTKLFKSGSYQAVSYGRLTSRKADDPSIAWSIEHTFAVTEIEMVDDKKIIVKRQYKFLFYFDNKMNVLRAESYS